MKIIYRFACASYDVGKLDNYMYATKNALKMHCIQIYKIKTIQD